MKILLCALLLTPVLALPLRAQETNTTVATPAPAIHITAADAGKHLNENAVVAGKVAQVNVRPAITILNFEKPYPDAPFSAVVFSRNKARFGALTNLENQNIEVSGTIKPYKGKPEIILSNATQLTIVGKQAK